MEEGSFRANWDVAQVCGRESELCQAKRVKSIPEDAKRLIGSWADLPRTKKNTKKTQKERSPSNSPSYLMGIISVFLAWDFFCLVLGILQPSARVLWQWLGGKC